MRKLRLGEVTHLVELGHEPHPLDSGALCSLAFIPASPVLLGSLLPSEAQTLLSLRACGLAVSNTWIRGSPVVGVQLLSHVWLFATPWTAAYQAPLSMGFFRQEYLNVLPFPSPGDFLRPGNELASPSLAGGFFTTDPPGKPGSSSSYLLTLYLKCCSNVTISLGPWPSSQPVFQSACSYFILYSTYHLPVEFT